MKRFIITIAALFTILTSNAQHPDVIVTGERAGWENIYDLELNILRPNNSVRLGDQVLERVTLFGHRQGHGVFTIAVNVTTASANQGDIGGVGYAPSTAQFNVLKNRIYKLTKDKQIVFVFDVPLNNNDWSRWNYRYRWVHGDAKAKPNEKFVYRLPFAADTTAMYGAYRDNTRADVKNMIWMNFDFENAATEVYPIRDGLVVRSDVDGWIWVQHEDGTIANYGEINSTILPGEQVTITEPFGTTKETELIIGLYYYSVNKDRKTNGEQTAEWRPFLTNFLNPIFALRWQSEAH